MTLASELGKAEKDIVLLFEIRIKKRLDNVTWTLYSAGTYSLAGELKNLAGVSEYLLSTKAITAYAPKASIAEVEAAASSYYYDATAKVLYVHTSTGADPGGGLFLVKATAWRYFSNGQRSGAKAVYYNGHFYDPRLAEDSIPDVSSSLRTLSEGGIEQTWGTIKILNGNGAYDAELGEWIWQMCLYYLRVGVPGGLYSDYVIISRGRTGNLTWDDDTFQLACESQMLAED